MGGDTDWPMHSCQVHWVKWPGSVPVTQAGLNTKCQEGGCKAGHRSQGPPPGTGRWPSTPDGCLHAGALATRAESPAELCSCPPSQLFSLTLLFLEDNSANPMGPGQEQRGCSSGRSSGSRGRLRLDTPCLPPLSLFRAKAGKRGIEGVLV